LTDVVKLVTGAGCILVSLKPGMVPRNVWLRCIHAEYLALARKSLVT
jgi:hypothetical protein